jgi:hypothetical protein
MSTTHPEFCLAVVVCAALLGCNSKGYDLAPVSGVVTLDGQPIPGTVVNFQPMAKDGKMPGPGSVGRCDETGRYVLRTINDEPGAVVGTHRVRIYSYSPESPVAQDTDAGLPEEQFPNRYNYGSKLTLEVESGGTGAADFTLTTAGE